MTNTQQHAIIELSILCKQVKDPIVKPFEKEILALCESFGKSGQSGGSYGMTANALTQTINKLLKQETISPLTGEDSEWNLLDYDDETKYQNNRESGVFKQKDGSSTYVDAIIWRGQYREDVGTDRWNDTFNGRCGKLRSSQKIKSFPFTPKTFYIDVFRELLPEDWIEEPFIEWDYYDTEDYEKNGSKAKLVTEKYRYKLVDESQLDAVWELYEKPSNF